MITFLATPKPFSGLADVQQRRAIRSWLALHPDVDVILCGDSEGADEAARELGATYVREVRSSPMGTPLVGGIAQVGKQYGRNSIQAYINCDILLVEDVIEAVRRAAAFPAFLMSGFRLDLTQGVDYDVAGSDWRERLFGLAREGRLEVSTGSDLFVYRTGLWDNAPDLVIGRGGVENAMFAIMRRRHLPLVDATQAILQVHQFHAYGHVAGGQDEVMRGQESLINRAQFGDWPPNIRDAQWIMDGSGLHKTYGHGDWLRETCTRVRFGMDQPGLARVVRKVAAQGTRIRPSREHKYTVSEMLAHLGYTG